MSPLSKSSESASVIESPTTNTRSSALVGDAAAGPPSARLTVVVAGAVHPGSRRSRPSTDADGRRGVTARTFRPARVPAPGTARIPDPAGGRASGGRPAPPPTARRPAPAGRGGGG